MTTIEHHTRPLVGRQHLLAECRQRIAEHRVVTLVGPGGVGKTRLVQELQTQLRTTHDVFFVDLSGSDSAAEVLNTATRALGRGQRQQGIEAALHDLRRRGDSLIILDNAEHIHEVVCTLCEDWVARHSSVRLLITSRRALELPYERVVEVPPLATSGPGQSEAVRCFLGALATDVSVEALGDLAHVQRVVRQLDGLPLALELAAARLSVMSVGQLVRRLDDLVQLLVDPSRPDKRHGALTPLLDHSWQALGEADRRAFAQLSLFRAPFALNDAEQALILPDHSVLDVLHRLVTHHLLSRKEGGKLHMLSTIRAYAAWRFTQLDEPQAARRRFVQVFAARSLACLDPEGTAVQVEPLVADIEHLEAALKHALDLGMTEQAVDLAAALGGYYCERGPIYRAAEVVRAVLDCDVTPTRAVRLWSSLAMSQRYLGDLDAAQATYEQMSEWAERDGDDTLGWRGASGLADLLSSTGKAQDSLVHYERAAIYARRAKLHSCLGNTLANHALTVHDTDGDGQLLAALTTEAIMLARTAGDGTALARVLQSVGSIHMDRDEVDEALALFTEARALALARNEQRRVGSLECMMGYAQQCEGRHDLALTLCRSALRRMTDAGDHQFSWVIRGIIASLPGRYDVLDDAIIELEAVVEALRAEGDRRMVDSFWACLVAGLATRGRLDEARRHLDELVREHTDATSMASAKILYELHACADREGQLEAVRRAREFTCDLQSRPGTQVWVRRIGLKVHAVERLATGWRVDEHGRWFESPTGPVISLERRLKPQKALAALVRSHLDGLGAEVSVPDLVTAAWPGEQMSRSSGQNRVRVAMSTLRKAGLASLLQHHEQGYRLDPEQSVSVVKSTDQG